MTEIDFDIDNVCEDCFSMASDVIKTICPYEQDLNARDVECTLCPQCIKDRADEL